jgi:hypothetical protein
MAFLTAPEIASLRIEQSVFHIVGPGAEHFQLLAAFDAGPHEQFFIGRVESVNGGNRYEFLDDAPVRAQLARINAGFCQRRSPKTGLSSILFRSAKVYPRFG